MIVHPDFFNHWKTKRLIQLTGDRASPIMVLKLWIYCQTQRKFEFEGLSPMKLVAICETELPAKKLLEILLECGFIRQAENTLIVHDWDKVNRSYISAWTNGSKGGRPITDRKPDGIRPGTSGKPISRAGVREEEENRVGFRPVIQQTTSPGKPTEDLAAPSERKSKLVVLQKTPEKSDPENLKKFGSLCGEIAQKLKGGSTP